MGQYTSYWLYQKYETRGSQDPIPCYPNVYSVDGDGTMPMVVRNEDDTQCGYVPPVEPVYRWIKTSDTACIQEGPGAQYRWVNMNPSTDYYCEGTTKYYKQKKQVSYDEGQTWQDVIPPEYQKGGVAEEQSTDCGYVPPTPQYRWVNMNPSTDYYCESTTKYYRQKKQVSYDEGQTWQDVSPAEYQKGGVAEEQSTDCGYVPPTPTNKKLAATYTGGITREVECNGSSTLTSGETKPSGYQASAMTNAVIGDCVAEIGYNTFSGCWSLTSVTIPNSVTSIGHTAFWQCSGLTSVNIPNSVTSIGQTAFWYCSSLTNINIPNGVTSINDWTFGYCSGLTSVAIPDNVTSIGKEVFYRCTSLTSITVNATTPPSLGGNTFDGTNNCPIYVPASSVDAYKSRWSTYASRIQAIP